MKRVGPLLSKLKNDEEDYNEQYELKVYDLLLNSKNEHWAQLDKCRTTKKLYRALEENGIHLLEYRELTPSEKRNLNSYFKAIYFQF